MRKYELFINGEYRPSRGEDVIQVENPATKEILALVPAGGKEDVEEGVQGAKEALDLWSTTAPKERRRYVEAMYQFLRNRKGEVAKTLSLELGCPLSFAQSRHVDMYLDNITDYLRIAEEYSYRDEYPGYSVLKEPVGVVACLTPWNYPFGQIVKKVIPALLTGNTVVLKPSKRTPLTAYWFAEAAKAAGLPKGVFQLIPGRGAEVGDLLAANPQVNMISFTGSTSGGKDVGKKALDTVKRLSLELGGKSAALFLEGADYEAHVKKVLDTVFLNTGQTCSAKTRLIAPRKDKERLEKLLVKEAKTYVFGDPSKEGVQVGPLQSEAQLKKVEGYLELGEKEATLLYRGERYPGPGYYVPPVIFTEVDPKARIAREEIFGPVLSVLYYDTLEEGIAMANDSIYGLSGMVFGPKEEAVKAALSIKTGQIQVNDGVFTQNAPFGGFKESGLGREGGLYGWEEFLELKTLFI